MNKEKLYNAIEIQNFKPIEVWDQMMYAAKILMCEQMIQSESWRNLPEDVLEKVEGGDELVLA